MMELCVVMIVAIFLGGFVVPMIVNWLFYK